MGYWPFYSSVAAAFWSITDNNMNWITNVTMAYMSYGRLRSIQSPKAFKDEFLLKKPRLVILGFWIFGFTVYPIILLICGTREFKTSINYQPEAMKSLVDILFWFSLLAAITILSVIFWLLLKKRQKNKKSVDNKKGKYHLSSQSRFLIMMYEIFFLLHFFFVTILKK